MCESVMLAAAGACHLAARALQGPCAAYRAAAFAMTAAAGVLLHVRLCRYESLKTQSSIDALHVTLYKCLMHDRLCHLVPQFLSSPCRRRAQPQQAANPSPSCCCTLPPSWLPSSRELPKAPHAQRSPPCAR